MNRSSERSNLDQETGSLGENESFFFFLLGNLNKARKSQ